MAIDPNKLATTGDFEGFLTPEESAPIFDQVEKTSVVQQLARQIPMGANGVDIPFWNGSVSANWVGEAAKKPVTKGAMGRQLLTPKKIATIFVESAEVVRANPGNYTTIMRSKIAEAIALAFDEAALAGNVAAGFSHVGQTTKSTPIEVTGASPSSVYDQFNEALRLLVEDGKKLNGYLLDDVTEPVINGAKDNAGRPLFIEATYTETNSPFRVGRTLGRPSYLSDHVASTDVVGYAGDWSQLVWGQVGGLSFDVTDQATLDLGPEGTPELVSLWQHNLVAVRVEAEYAILCNDPEAFVKLTPSEASV